MRIVYTGVSARRTHGISLVSSSFVVRLRRGSTDPLPNSEGNTPRKGKYNVSEKANAARREYMRAYRQTENGKKRIAEAQRRYWERKYNEARKEEKDYA